MKIILMLSAACLLVSGCSSDHTARPTDRRSVAETTNVDTLNRTTRTDTLDHTNRMGRTDNLNRTDSFDRTDRMGRTDRMDRSDELLTPQNQSENPEDRRITQQARQAIVKRTNLSTNAKNVKIITIDRVVQLRGNVDSDAERREVVQVIRNVPGIQRVDEKLVISNKGE